ncbi:MAG: DUF2065 domain-containing protein [Proteobacteria bacterium]|jgi:uncharacterized protein|nr:DUF2065 domain-containing protein [Pseudomonadota bacterium]
MWKTLLLAFALMLVIEGLLPTVNPDSYRRTVKMISALDNRTLRIWGLVSMITGALLVYLFTH